MGDIATGGVGADRFFVGRDPNQTLRITDYNYAEGDWLVLDGTQFTADELQLRTQRNEALDGSTLVLEYLALVRVNDAGAVVQTVFTFDNPADLDHLFLRLPNLAGVGLGITIDLL